MSLCFAGALFYIRPGPQETAGGAFDDQQGIALVIEGRGLAIPPLTFTVSVNETIDSGLLGCGDAEVTAVFQGTSGFWSQFSGMPERAKFALAITGDDVRDVDILAVRFGLDPAALGTFRYLLLGQEERRAARKDVHLDDPRNVPRGIVVTGSVDGLKRTWLPLVVHFTASWTRFRAFGSCFVSSPSLTSSAASEEAQKALERVSDIPVTGDGSATEGVFELNALSGRVLTSDSNPPPQSVTRQGHRWECSTVRGSLRRIAEAVPRTLTSPDKTGTAVRPAPAGRRPLDCAATIVVSMPHSEAIRSFLLLLLGALISLGCQIFYDGSGRGRVPR